MIQFLTGKQQKSEKKVQNDITDILKNQLKKVFCQLCEKNPATKVAFGKQFKPVFTCSSCEMKAVGGVPQRLGPKTLITTDKYAQIITKQLISCSNKNPPVEYKKPAQSCQSIKDKTIDLTTKILQEYKKMKKVVKDKESELYQQSLKQNAVHIFEEVNKLLKDKKINQIDNGYLILKRSHCNNKGLHFSDQQAIQTANQAINEKVIAIKKQSKIKLKGLEELIDEINAVQLD